MSRQSPNRNQRSKGIKINHVLQICLLVAICFWLIYQVKHSHDRKKEFDKSDEKVLIRRESTDVMIKLGRKDVTHSQVEEIVSKNAEHDDELEEEEEEDKNEEDVQGEKKIRGNENEGLRGEEEEEEEEEEIDEQERERLETEVDREEDFVDDQEEGQDGDDQENEEKYSEDTKKDVSHVEDADGDGDDRSSHEAREEHYKADDASSHDTQLDREKSSEHLDLVLVKEKKELNSEVTNTSENIKELGVENGQMAKGSNGSDGTSTETLLGYSQNGSFSNNTMTEGSHHRVEVTNSSTEVTLGNHSSSLGNITESMWGDGTSEVGKNEIFDSRMPWPETFEQVQNVFSDI
ncbi:uncharacterized protein [Henckelia pumila]|uniref:uncharacterized protein n=1 Tax=Henckelia pumila TaxID=405737 RepID=UPI003C6E1EC2